MNMNMNMNKIGCSLVSMLMTTLCVSTLTAASLSPGRYVFQSGNGDTWDAGWALNVWGNGGAAIHPFSLNNGPDQQFNFLANGQIQSVANPSMYLADRGGILVFVGQNQNPDQFAISSSGGGYIIQDTTDGGNYIGNNQCGTGASCNIPLSTSAAVWFVPGGSSSPVSNVSSSPSSTVTIDDTDASIVYSAGNNVTGGPYTNWDYIKGSGGDFDQDDHSSNFARGGATFQGASAAITFTGTGITWIGKKGPQYGMATYAVDGGPAQTFDGYNPTEIDQNANATISGLAFGPHVLQISLLPAKNTASSDYYQAIDAFQINGSPLPRSSATIAGYNSAQLVSSGSWQCGGNNPGDLSGGHCWTGAANSSLSWTFTGSLVEMFGRPDLEDGSFQVYIDGNYITTVDCQFGNVDDDALNSVMLFSRQVSSGKHTIKIVVTGTNDDKATNSLIQIDEFVAFQ
jgi:hypothetical protein